MNEEELRNLIKNSQLKPSDHFTHKVMTDIENELKPKKRFSWIFITVCICGILSLILLALFIETLPSEFQFMNISVKIHPVFMPMVIAVFIMFEFYRIFEARQKALTERI